MDLVKCVFVLFNDSLFSLKFVCLLMTLISLKSSYVFIPAFIELNKNKF